MPVTLKNRTRQPLPLQLDHDGYCRALGRCECEPAPLFVPGYVSATQTAATRTIEKLAPKAITLFSQGELRGLPDAVLEAADVKSALKRGAIVSTRTVSPGAAGGKERRP